MQFNKKLNEEATEMLECLIENLLFGVNRHRTINVIEKGTGMSIQEVFMIIEEVLEEKKDGNNKRRT